MKISLNKQIFRTAAIAGTCIVPAAYITEKHVNLYPQNMPRQRKEMKNKMIGFFAGMVPGLVIVHKFARTNLKKTKNLIGGITGALITTIGASLGLEISKRINNQQYNNKKTENTKINDIFKSFLKN